MMIGDYRILRKLGSGGMGIVYEAEQQHPKRLVALKVIKGGRFVDDSHVKLFEREAQALARLKHPGIAAIYESGRTEEGQHFFAMELVRGETLKEYLEKSLSGGPMTPVQLRECLAIFRKIADAVTYAHQRGVIHRDLKPPNIIVLREFEPSGSESEPQTPAIKILDFGLARITETDLAVTTIGTELGAIQGTLPYMSPEQVRGNPDEIDVRSDVYSLGVILYEMIAGKRPYNVQNAMLHEAARIICEVPPDPLSKSWSGTKRLDKDLETIVGKALEKKAPLRYQNVSAFGEDVSRFLAGQPILARPPSAMYQLRKMALRHKLGFAFAASLLVLIAAFSIGMSIQARRIARERDRANQEAETSKQLSEFLVGLFTVSDPGEARGNSVTAREILDKGAQKIEGELGDRPIPKAEMMRTIGGVYTSLGLYKQAQPLLEKSLAITRTAASSTPLAKSNSLLQLAILYDTQGRFTEALPLAQESLLIREKALGPEHLDAARALLEVGIIHRKTGKYADAKRCLERSLAIREKALGPEHVEVMDALSHLGWLYTLMRNYPEATRCYERVLAVREKLGPDQPEVAMALSDLGLVRVDMGDYDAALKFLQRALAIREKVLGPNHYEVANTVDGIGTVFWYQGKLQEARPYYERALEIREKAFGPEHFHVAGSLHNLALLLSTMGEEEKSRPLDERALAIEEKVFGPENPNLAQGFYNLAILLSRLGEYSEARRLLGRALEISEKAY
jgi:serine/threonine protein kinase/Tfp pilus assembly protein PilF